MMGISESVSGSKRTDKSMKLMLYCVLLSFAAICREPSVRTKAICRLHVHHTGSLLQNKGAIPHASVHSVHIASKIDITLLLCYSQKNNRTERKGCDGAMTLEQLAFISEVEAAGTIVAAAKEPLRLPTPRSAAPFPVWRTNWALPFLTAPGVVLL